MRDFQINELADICGVSLEDSDLVCARATRQTRPICFTRPFTKNFYRPPDQSFSGAFRRAIDDQEQIVIARFLHALIDLTKHRSGGSSAPWRVTKNESIIELHAFN